MSNPALMSASGDGSNDCPVYDTRMVKALQTEFKQPKQWFVNAHYRDTSLSDKKKVEFRKETDEVGLAPFVCPCTPGEILSDPRGGEVTTMEPAYIKPKAVLDPCEAPTEMRLGETPYDSLPLRKKWDMLVAWWVRRLPQTIELRWEWMATRAAFYGKYTVVGKNYPRLLMDFQRNPCLTVYSNRSWDDPLAFALRDWDDWNQKLFTIGERRATHAYFGVDAWNAASNSVDFREKLAEQCKCSTQELMLKRVPTATEQGVELMGKIGSVSVYVDSRKFRNPDTGKEEYFLPSDALFLMSDSPNGGGFQGIKHFGAIWDVNSLRAEPIFQKMWKCEDNGVTMMNAQSAPLLIPTTPNNTMLIRGVGMPETGDGSLCADINIPGSDMGAVLVEGVSKRTEDLLKIATEAKDADVFAIKGLLWNRDKPVTVKRPRKEMEVPGKTRAIAPKMSANPTKPHRQITAKELRDLDFDLFNLLMLGGIEKA